MSDQLRFYKICENAKLPVREHLSDAGMDLFYCPEADSSLDCRWGMDKNELWIAAGETCLVPTGLKAMIPRITCLKLKINQELHLNKDCLLVLVLLIRAIQGKYL